MNSELKLKTITSMEIAEMMEIPHYKIIRKLEGNKERKGYISILTEHQMVPSDFFIRDTYKDSSGKENKCYYITKMGCDFLANKFTGEKGVLFTARYVRRFHEMEQMQMEQPCPLNPTIAASVADLARITEKIMRNQGSAPYKIAEVFKSECEQFGIRLPDDFVVTPVFAQTSFFGFLE